MVKEHLVVASVSTSKLPQPCKHICKRLVVVTKRNLLLSNAAPSINMKKAVAITAKYLVLNSQAGPN